MKPSCPVLRREDFFVSDCPLKDGQELVARLHYSKGGSNTRTYMHGLYRKADGELVGVAWWIPPTKSAALATHPENWNGVLALSRLVVADDVPQNGASFLLGASMKRVDRLRWPVLVTYADTWQGHTGAIYKATNWAHVGRTKRERTYTIGGRMVSRKAGPKTRTHAEMLQLGAEMVGSYSKEKFVHIVRAETKGREK